MGAATRDPDREATLFYCLDMLEQISQLLVRGAGEPDLGRIVSALVKSHRSYTDVDDASPARPKEARTFHASA